MRRISRLEITDEARSELSSRTKKSSDYQSARTEWDAFRSSAKSKQIIDVLKQMAGIRQRCFYCSDSRSADIDHFEPIAHDFRKAFEWVNLIWTCPECNRMKGKQFKVDAFGKPLIINPTSVDPWDHLVLDSDTGLLVARFDGNSFDLIGETTLSVLKCINHEAVTEGRSRVVRRYREAVQKALDECNNMSAFDYVAREVREDDYGLYQWFTVHEGSSEHPFQSLKEDCHDFWEKFVDLAASAY